MPLCARSRHPLVDKPEVAFIVGIISLDSQVMVNFHESLKRPSSGLRWRLALDHRLTGENAIDRQTRALCDARCPVSAGLAPASPLLCIP
jgi:hypothetical protein